ncbi:MAG: flavodoxin [Eubacteriales bacterium]|nr:flavodoxin [Eubacteriales bacterium]
MKTLILYYSYLGNTKRIAEMIQKEIGGDMARIETVVPYDSDYNKVVNQGQDEVNRGYMPKLKPLDVRFEDYDRIILGTPVWWYTFAPAMHTFLANHDFSGKTVYPFVTNGGWIGHTPKDIAAACKGAKIERGINIKFDEDQLRTSETEIRKWIQGIR